MTATGDDVDRRQRRRRRGRRRHVAARTRRTVDGPVRVACRIQQRSSHGLDVVEAHEPRRQVAEHLGRGDLVPEPLVGRDDAVERELADRPDLRCAGGECVAHEPVEHLEGDDRPRVPLVGGQVGHLLGRRAERGRQHRPLVVLEGHEHGVAVGDGPLDHRNRPGHQIVDALVERGGVLEGVMALGRGVHRRARDRDRQRIEQLDQSLAARRWAFEADDDPGRGGRVVEHLEATRVEEVEL